MALIFSDCRDIYIGDAIVRINGEVISEASHEDALELLQVHQLTIQLVFFSNVFVQGVQCTYVHFPKIGSNHLCITLFLRCCVPLHSKAQISRLAD